MTFETLITFLTIENNNPNIYRNPSIRSDTGRHSQFLRFSMDTFETKIPRLCQPVDELKHFNSLNLCEKYTIFSPKKSLLLQIQSFSILWFWEILHFWHLRIPLLRWYFLQNHLFILVGFCVIFVQFWGRVSLVFKWCVDTVSIKAVVILPMCVLVVKYSIECGFVVAPIPIMLK